MGTVYGEIDQKLRDWLLAQPVFFVSTAPLSADGHVNISPKGMDGTFAVLGSHRVGYLDYYGSGAETIAHLRENGRIVIMCCAFTGPPKIVRLHGRGRIVLAGDPEYAATRRAFGKPRDLGLRSIIVVDVDRVADSCGFSVPLMNFVADRDLLDRSHGRREPQYSTSTAPPATRSALTGCPRSRPGGPSGNRASNPITEETSRPAARHGARIMRVGTSPAHGLTRSGQLSGDLTR